MDYLSLSPSKYLLLGSSQHPSGLSTRRFFALPNPSRKRREGPPNTGNIVSALGKGSIDGTLSRRFPKNVLEKLGVEAFASVSSSSRETSLVGVNPLPSAPPPPSSIGSPLFWIGVGVGLSALFSWVATNLKKYAMQQAFKTLMGQMSTENKQFNDTAFSLGSQFPFPSSTASAPAESPSPVPSRAAVTVDVPATEVSAAQDTEVKVDPEIKKEPKNYAFVDVSTDELLQKSPFESSKSSVETSSSKDVQSAEEVSQNGAATKQDMGASSEQSKSTRKPGSVLSVEALEKMMEDPTVQKMVYPYLPEEMKNPATFKWMLQNPQYRQQLEDMLNNMGGSTEWDNQVMDSLKNFDLSSPEVKQQFDQIGLTPEEVISKIMANPEVAMAFQNPRVQAAIMDCSQNPLSIAKYQNDKEVMDVFNKISELFPGVSGSP
ncbi:protein TIC 40, chloroplastic-like [Telopea speciosissima]|uniref:protein TIC 40, chloroplastic-like n=1 Tax=Telopea speciosissima TaxID=54955 RepID=UPI001CC6053D|nr:protein TIC 40, chloroplastic-like [Telopea speciosissima]